MMKDNDLDPRIPLIKAARILGLHPITLRRWIDRGLLVCEQNPGRGRIYIRESELMKVIKKKA